MADEFLGAQDLDIFTRNVLANNPYSQMGQFVQQTPLDMTTWSPASQGIGSFAKSFLGGLLNNYAQQNVAQQRNAAMQALPSLIMNPLSTPTPEGVDPAAFDVLRSKATMGDLLSATLADRQMKSAYGQAMGQGKAQLDLTNMRQSQLGQMFGRPVESLEPSMGPKLGLSNASDVENQEYQRKIMMGVPPEQAAVSARTAAQDARKRSQELLTSPLKQLQESTADMEKIIRIGEEGIEKAGITGVPGASTFEKYASYLPWASEAKKQTEGDTLLDQTKQMGVAINRVAGTGALSDFESRVLFNTAMGSDKTPDQNKAILQLYKNALAEAKEYESFLRYASENTSASPERIRTLWKLYKEENPILVKSDDGTLMPNTDKKPWQQFDFENAYKGFLTGQKPIPSAREFAMQARARGLSKEQARAEWQALTGGQ